MLRAFLYTTFYNRLKRKIDLYFSIVLNTAVSRRKKMETIDMVGGLIRLRYNQRSKENYIRGIYGLLAIILITGIAYQTKIVWVERPVYVIQWDYVHNESINVPMVQDKSKDDQKEFVEQELPEEVNRPMSTMQEMSIADKLSLQIEEATQLMSDLQTCQYSVDALEKQEKVESVLKVVEKSVSEYPDQFSMLHIQVKELEEELIAQKVRVAELLEEDVHLVACVIQAEVGSIQGMCRLSDEDTVLAKQYTASALINRTKNPICKANTIQDAVSQPNQYATYRSGKIQSAIPEPANLDIARDMLVNGTIGPDTLIYQSCEQLGEKYVKVGNQYFGLIKQGRE